jgi:hypothetical protein
VLEVFNRLLGVTFHFVNNMNMAKIKWATKSKQLICVDDMSEAHVRNALKYLIKNHPNYCEKCGYVVTDNFPHEESCGAEKPFDYTDYEPHYYEGMRITGL